MKNYKFLFILLYLVSNNIKAQTINEVFKAANEFIATLNQAESSKTIYAFSDSLRYKWTNLPIGLVPRPGIAYGSLTDKSRLAFHRILSSILSSQGYLKTTSIMRLDDILNELYQQAYVDKQIDEKLLKRMQDLKWAHGNFFISIFGTPSLSAPWGLNFGGHHIALSFSTDGKSISVSPYFIGTDPSEVKSGKYAGLRLLSKEEDYGFMLINSLNASQKAKAVLSKVVPKDIITHPGSSQRIDELSGINAKDLDKTQKAFLKQIIEEYVHNFEHGIAHRLIQKLEKSKLKNVYFSWIGSLERDKPHYYLINSPDFLIEYDNVGFQNDGNHIHAILREKGNEFGEDILKKHYLETAH